MINLRYHIVSLTAVFLAIGIGLTLGSTFLDRATVENLNGQLESLEQRIQDRDEQIQELQSQLESLQTLNVSLDEQATDLLAGRLSDVPVVVIAPRGVDDADVRGSIQSLVVAEASVQGLWWLTDRFVLDDEGEVNDLALALDVPSTDPARLRRTALTRLAEALRVAQTVDPTEEEPDPPGEDAGAPASETTAPPDAAEPDAIEALDQLVSSLVDAGFIEFEAVAGGPDAPTFAAGSRILFGAGSTSVPDDLVLEPLVSRMANGGTGPLLGVVGSAMEGAGGISDIVTVIRQDEDLRELVPTVDTLEHFHGWAAMVLALDDVADGIVGHYGLDDSATRLLPPLRSP